MLLKKNLIIIKVINFLLLIFIISIVIMDRGLDKIIYYLIVAIPILLLSYIGKKERKTKKADILFSDEDIKKFNSIGLFKKNFFFFLIQIGILVALIYGNKIDLYIYIIYFIVLVVSLLYVLFNKLVKNLEV